MRRTGPVGVPVRLSLKPGFFVPNGTVEEMSDVVFNNRETSTDTEKHPITSRIVLGCEVFIFWIGLFLFLVETILSIPFLILIWTMLRIQDRADASD